MSQHHPDPASIRLAVRDIRQVYDRTPNGVIEMSECYIVRDPPPESSHHRTDDNKCGTVACLGGWYYLSQISPDIDLRFEDCALVGEPGNPIVWHQGGNLLAQRCGLGGTGTFAAWALNHPELWGNYRGAKMFESIQAYEPLEDMLPGRERRDRMTVILDHLLGVADRIEAAQKAEADG